MKKVLFVATVDIHIRSFHLPYLKMLKDAGYEVHVATNGDERFLNCDFKHTISIERSPFSLKNLKAIKELRKIIKKERFDLVHCHTPMGSVVARLAAKKYRKMGTKVIYTAHGFHFYKGSSKLSWLLFYPVEKYLSRYTDTLVTINKEDYVLAKRKFRKCQDIEYVKGVGLPSLKFDFSFSSTDKMALRKSLGLKKDDFVILYTARLDRNKNQGFLIEVMEKIVKKYNNVHLLLVGPDELDGVYQKMVREKNLCNYVHFLGYRTDIPKLLKIADLAVSTSLREGLPVNIMEALMSELPVLALKCRGVSDLIENGKNGYIVEEKNQDAFLEKVVYLIKNSKERERIIAQTRLSVSDCELESIQRQFCKIYGIEMKSSKRIDNPLVSVIMAEYNTDLTLLKKSLLSILSQTYQNLEVILIDDCGVNDVAKLVKGFKDKRIKVFKNSINKGLVYSLNRALELASGKYVVRMDTDDWSYQKRIELQVDFMENNPQYALCAGRAVLFDGVKDVGVSKFYGEVTRDVLLNGSPIIHPSVIAKRDILNEVGGYPDYKRCEDYALWIELFSRGYKLYVMDEIVLKYHISISDYSKRTLKTRAGYLRLLKEKYQKLNPSLLQYWKMKFKTIVAGMMPYRLMAFYHKLKFKNK